MAFVRRKGNAYYLVHNVRRGGKVKQLHLARLGERAKITSTIVREVSKKHPFVDLNWRALRDQLILSSRSMKFVMALQRLKYRLRHPF